jgi:hypothetical protein
MKTVNRRTSPSLVVACLALFVALGGTSVAAVSALLPRNSVGTPQLKENAVTAGKIAAGAVQSSEVKDGSLAGADFAPGQLPAGPAGPPGPSHVYAHRLVGPAAVPFHAEATLTSMSVPEPGSYLVLANALASGHGTVTCNLRAETDFDLSQATPNASSNQTIALIVAHAFAAPGHVDLVCAGDGDSALSFIDIAAIKVGKLTTG